MVFSITIDPNLKYVFKDESYSREYIENYTAKTPAILPQNYSEKYLRQNAISRATSSAVRPSRQPRQQRPLRKSEKSRKPKKLRKPHQTKGTDSQYLLAKKEEEILVLRGAIRNLNARVGIEDLTIKQKRMEGMLLSSSDDEGGSGNQSNSEDEDVPNENHAAADLNGESSGASNSNKENVPSNMQQENTSDMMFSFSHQYTQNVSKFSGVWSVIIYYRLCFFPI